MAQGCGDFSVRERFSSSVMGLGHTRCLRRRQAHFSSCLYLRSQGYLCAKTNAVSQQPRMCRAWEGKRAGDVLQEMPRGPHNVPCLDFRNAGAPTCKSIVWSQQHAHTRTHTRHLTVHTF